MDIQTRLYSMCFWQIYPHIFYKIWNANSPHALGEGADCSTLPLWYTRWSITDLCFFVKLPIRTVSMVTISCFASEGYWSHCPVASSSPSVWSPLLQSGGSPLHRPPPLLPATLGHHRVSFLHFACPWSLSVPRNIKERLTTVDGSSIQFILYSPISQMTNLPQRALQSVHIRHPWPLTSHRIRKNYQEIEKKWRNLQRRIPLQDGQKQ